MTWQAWLLLAAYLAVLLLLAEPLGSYIAGLMDPPRWRALVRVESLVLRGCGTSGAEMGWRQYAVTLLVFNAIGLFATYALQRLQAWLPLNPQKLGAIAPDSSFNTAVSFVTNTNWQGYAGESTMSHLTQMLGLGVQNFLSAASGICVLFALTRAFARQSVATIGNFWLDVYRCTVYLLLPLALVLAVVLVGQGVVQNFLPTQHVTPLESSGIAAPGGKPGDGTQALPMGPAASQVAIKQLGTNGGGFFNANSAHPFENPTPLSNFLQMLAILLIPAALCHTFGRAVGDARQGRAILAAMTLIFVAAAVLTMRAEQQGNPRLTVPGVDQAAGTLQTGGNMEGKEIRHGVASSALWAVATTAASNGSVNSMHDSFTPLGGLAPLLLIQLGEVVYGGVGSGLYGMLVFALMAVFLSGLMIGRTPEYLGKKIEVFEMKMVALVILATPALVLPGTALAVASDAGRVAIQDPGPHGFVEVLYAFSSAANNNGSAFAGLGANTPFYNGWLGIAMWFGRFAIIVPVLAIAGSLAMKKRVPQGPGTLPTHGILFVALLVGTVLLVGALTYLPALALGPVVEHLELWQSP